MHTAKPTCIGFIMDGNRRWANAQGKETIFGHKRGAEVFMDSIEFVRDEQIPHAVYYAFSTENWQRSEAEVEYLMKLFKTSFETVYEKFAAKENAVRFRFIGNRTDFSSDLQALMEKLETDSAGVDAKTTVWIALSYGGRAEIVAAANAAIATGAPVTEESFKKHLWTAKLPDPDIIVRTSGEQRLSNFLSWSAAYSELYFVTKHWPALTQTDFADILTEYAKRERRRGQ